MKRPVVKLRFLQLSTSLFMEFVELKSDKKIEQAVLKVLRSGQYILGKNVEKLEKAIADFVGTKYAVAVNSGSDALFLCLRALDIGEGDDFDEVITSPFTFSATAEAIVRCGAKPVFADIDSNTFNIDPLQIEKKITKRTKAIIPVHLFGQMADMNKIKHIAERNNLLVIEDAAQAFGAEYIVNNEWKKAGDVGIAGCFSFFPTKVLGACGDAGMITTDIGGLAEKIRLLRNHGMEQKYNSKVIGYSSRMDEIQAAILLAKLPFLKDWLIERGQMANRYNEALEGLTWFPYEGLNAAHIYSQYTIRERRRDDLRNYLKAKGIPTAIYYPIPLHLQPAFSFLGYKKGDFPIAENVSQEVLSLPLYPGFKPPQQKKVIKAIKEFYDRY